MMADFRGLLREIGGKVLPNGSIADDASVALHRLRRDIERQQKSIHQSLERFLKSHRDEGVLQEEYVAIRNDRFVVPVVAGQKRRVDGVIHGASSSGQTLFVEPLETIDLNNELVRLHEEEQREVFRILREITDKLRAHCSRYPPDDASGQRTGPAVREGSLRRRLRLRDSNLRSRITSVACSCAKLVIRCCRMCFAGSKSASFP